jgi:hypothetical protein
MIPEPSRPRRRPLAEGRSAERFTADIRQRELAHMRGAKGPRKKGRDTNVTPIRRPRGGIPDA